MPFVWEGGTRLRGGPWVEFVCILGRFSSNCLSVNTICSIFPNLCFPYALWSCHFIFNVFVSSLTMSATNVGHFSSGVVQILTWCLLSAYTVPFLSCEQILLDHSVQPSRWFAEFSVSVLLWSFASMLISWIVLYGVVLCWIALCSRY